MDAAAPPPTASSVHPHGRSWLSILLGLIAFCGLWPANAWAAVGGEISGLELTPQARWQMHQMHDAWQQWSRSFESGDGRESIHLDRMLASARALGLRRLPDLAAAAAAYAVQAAEAGNGEKAQVALAAARRLDDGRPEVDFAAARVARAQGDYIGFAKFGIAGMRARLALPLERMLMGHNALLWLLISLAVAAALYVALFMVVEGGALFYDVARLISPPVDRRAADFLTLLLLLWPLALPSGVLWLVLYWSVLLWAYATTNERIVLVFCWLLVGTLPIALAQQQRAVQLAMAPPTRLLDNLEQERLTGSLFTDAEALVTLLPDSPAVTEVMADIHRRLGQWDYARAIYTELTQDPEQSQAQTATAYNNLGVYYHRKKEYPTAITYFKRATEANPRLAHAYFNMGQSLAQLYDFNQSHAALGEAKALDSQGVERWNEITKGVDPADAVVAIDGGLARTGEIRERLQDVFRGGADQRASAFELWRRHIGLTVALFCLLLALALGQARRQVGFRSTALDTTPFLLDHRWMRTLAPGIDAANDDNGVVAFLALLAPVAAVCLILLCRYSLHSAIAFDPTCAVAAVAGTLALLIIFAARYRGCA